MKTDRALDTTCSWEGSRVPQVLISSSITSRLRTLHQGCVCWLHELVLNLCKSGLGYCLYGDMLMWHCCLSQEAGSGSGEEAGSGEDEDGESAEEEGSEDEGDEEGDSESSPEPEARVLPQRATRGNRMQGVMEEEDEADQQFWGASIGAFRPR